MNSTTAERLIDLNRDFYTKFGDSFSSTRHRIQPGMHRILLSLRGDEDILDLGCGNGWLARELAERHHRGTYLGLDFSLPLLRDAQSISETFSATFQEIDLTALRESTFILQLSSFDLITSFAVFHHIPSREIRLGMLNTVHRLLKSDGLFIHSNWQFLNSEKLKARIQPWETVAISSSDVDAGDYLLDWRSGEVGLRYVHHFDETELNELARESGFEINEIFYSDGETKNLGLYQIWKKKS